MSSIISFFPKIDKLGVGMKAGGGAGWKIFQKIGKRGGDDY